MPTYYLGTTKSGATVSRKSTNPAFTHAAVRHGYKATDGRLPSFSTSAQGAWRNYEISFGKSQTPEIVEVAQVDAKTYREATGKR